MARTIGPSTLAAALAHPGRAPRAPTRPLQTRAPADGAPLQPQPEQACAARMLDDYVRDPRAFFERLVRAVCAGAREPKPPRPRKP